MQDERVNMRFWLRGQHVPSATVVIAVFRRAGSNAVEVSQAVRDLLPSIRAELPASVSLVPIYDRSQTIVNSVRDVKETLVIAFVLVVFIIFVFLGRTTDTLIPAIALPLSLLLTFIAMQMLAYSLDNLSLMALTLAIGFLVDDAIVFLENTVRRMEAGRGALEATLESARDISFTILAMTISLAAVFIPLVFMSGLIGRIFREFNHTPSLRVDVLRDQAKLNGISEARILSLLRSAYSQNFAYLIKKPNNQYQVIVEVEDADREEPQNLNKLYIKSDDGLRMVPLRAVTTAGKSVGPQAVNHIDQFTSVSMFFNLRPGFSIGQATDFVERAAKDMLPHDVRGSLQGQALTFRETVSSLAVLMLLAVFVMYVILAILYESYLHPITVLSSLPVALVGGLLTLWAFGAEASLYAYIGMFMLMGIVKKNGIMIVDFAQQRVERGLADDEAIHEASMERFRPILMTTLAALMGALPIALGFGADGASRQPLGLVVVGGLVVSQFITLYVTPAIYLYLEDFQEKVLDRSSFFRAVRPPRPGTAGAGEPVHP